MTVASRAGRNVFRAVAVACVLALVAAGVMWWAFQHADSKRISAYFTAAVGVYPGGDVKMLGVSVGRIDTVQPQGTTVRVDMSVDRSVKVPADAKAVVVAPSVVSDRYVQLTPTYTSGPQLTDGAVIPRERTATPVELDELYKSLNQLTTALGPNGANKNGALSNLLNTAAANLNGNGQALNNVINQLGQATGTLADSREDLFATVDNLQKFTTMLAQNDNQVRQFNQQLADTSGFLAGEKDDLGAALHDLAVALAQVQAFIKDNRAALKGDVDKLASITQVLVDQRNSLAEILDVAPTALGNLQNAYNAASGTLDTRADINELTQPPLVTVCKLLQQAQPKQVPAFLSTACGQLAPVLSGAVPLPSSSQAISALQQGKLPPLPLPVVGTLLSGQSTTAQGGHR
ncbi:MCE family protein [Gandjariella thermophila]|uniref:ABC transporter substrate-binding protein n=1 Tax=Gandjariella thermophila TaxID=1931992 RepID=A0A4D4J415_9PSEU|nr:MCE family protein [Gandjariella thermophila]GDY29369.1 ABC transporter substrate-binding protein [Gandjariella thermophila]